MDNEDYPDMTDIAEDECSVCGSYEVVVTDDFGYPFCAQHDHRGFLLIRGRKNGWPALRIVDTTGTYAIDSDWQAYILSAFFGTDERVLALLEALNEYEELAKAS